MQNAIKDAIAKSMKTGSYQDAVNNMYATQGEKIKLVVVIIFMATIFAVLFARIICFSISSENSEILPAIMKISMILWAL